MPGIEPGTAASIRRAWPQPLHAQVQTRSCVGLIDISGLLARPLLPIFATNSSISELLEGGVVFHMININRNNSRN